MADSQVKTANICNITSSTTLSPNVGGSGTYISDNNISVYMSGTVAWSGIYCQYTNVDAVVNDYYTISFTPICATNSTLQIEVAGTAKKITFTSGTRTSVTIQASSTSRYVAFYGGDTVEKTIIIKDIQIEKGETATPYRPYSATGWQHSLRKLTTATETVENPLYSDGTAITAYTLKGNEEHTGTPTPSNPVDVNGVGERTENLFDGQLQQGYYAYATGDYTLGDNYVCTHLIPCTENTTYTFRCINASGGSKNYGYVFFDSAQNRIGSDYINELTEGDVVTYTATTPQNTAFLAINVAYGRRVIYVHPSDITDFMLNTGSTPKPYEPYGYKIPISSGGVTTNIYLGSTQSTRQIKKLVLTGEENWQESQRTGGYRFMLGIPSALQSDTTVGAKSYCSHFKLVGTGQTYALNNAYTISATSELFMTLGATERLADFTTYLANQYANGTPVTVWYVLATPETGIVNEPLMKIGTYADTLSNAASIPTTEGANSITVDTTVQPSEFTATWTGWHDASVKEYEGGVGNNKFDEQYPDIKFDVMYRPLYVGSGEFTCTSTCPRSQYGAQLFILAGNVSSGASTNTNGVWNGAVRSVTAVDGYVTIVYRNAGGVSPSDYDTMLNAGSTALPHEPYEYGWE